MQQLLLDIRPAPPATLDNFATGAAASSNSEAVASLRAAATSNEQQSFYLWGPASSGKSHLLAGFEHEARKHNRDIAILNGAGAITLETPPDILIVDNVDRADDAAQGRLFHLFNQVRDAGGIFAAAGNTAPMQLTLREDLRTRLGWGLIYEIKPLSELEIAMALQSHAARQGMPLPDEVVQYLLKRVQRDLTTLTRIVDALDRYSLTHKRPVTLPLVREAISAQEAQQQ